MTVGVGASSSVTGFLAGTWWQRRIDSRTALVAGGGPDSHVDAVVCMWLGATVAELTHRLARAPSLEELAAALGSEPDAALEAMDRRYAHRSQSEHADEHRQQLLMRLRALPARERRTAVRFVYEADVWPSASSRAPTNANR